MLSCCRAKWMTYQSWSKLDGLRNIAKSTMNFRFVTPVANDPSTALIDRNGAALQIARVAKANNANDAE